MCQFCVKRAINSFLEIMEHVFQLNNSFRRTAKLLELFILFLQHLFLLQNSLTLFVSIQDVAIALNLRTVKLGHYASHLI